MGTPQIATIHGMVLDQPPSRIEKRTDEMRMSLGDHIEELRKRLILALIGVAVCTVITFCFGFEIIAWLAQPILQAQEAVGYQPRTISTDPTAGFVSVYIKVCLIAAAIIASPWIVFQVWSFIVEGLYEHEKRALHVLWPFSLLMTILGVLFAYYILLPICFFFFMNWSTKYPEIEMGRRGFVMRMLVGEPKQSDDGDTLATATTPLQFPVLTTDPLDLKEGMTWINGKEQKIKTYLGGQTRTLAVTHNRLLTVYPDLGANIGFAAMVGLGIVIAFQLPVIMMVVGKTGLINPNWIVRLRKYALFGCFAISALLTPADLLSMVVLSLPLYVLFELGLALMKWTYPRLNDDD